MLNNTRPSTKPWGTPLVTVLQPGCPAQDRLVQLPNYRIMQFFLRTTYFCLVVVGTNSKNKKKSCKEKEAAAAEGVH